MIQLDGEFREKTGEGANDWRLYLPKTTWDQVMGKPNLVTTDTAQTVSGKKTFTGYYYMNGKANSTDTAPQFYGLRIKGGSTGYGAQLNFGDGNYIYFYEYEDDRLRLHTKKFDLDSLSEGLSINGNVGTEGQVLTSHGAKAPTWETPSGGSGNYVTLDTAQTITGSKKFEGSITIKSAGADLPSMSIGIGQFIWSHTYAGVGRSCIFKLPEEKQGGTIALTDDIDPLNFFRVGYVYISYTSTSPASMFGGSWTELSRGAFIMAAGAGYSTSWSVTGTNEHSHNYGVGASNWYGAAAGGIDGSGLFAYNSITNELVRTNKYNKAGTLYLNTGVTSAFGPVGPEIDITLAIGTTSNASHTPKYVTAHIWRRTA